MLKKWQRSRVQPKAVGLDKQEVESLKKYMVYMDDGKDCFKVAVPAINEDAAKEYVKGNGEVIAVKDVTEDYKISIDKVRTALMKEEFSVAEVDFITRCLTFSGIAD